MKLIPCMWCGALFEDIEGPTHRYMESTPGCWAAYGDVLAREYSSLEYFEIHRLTVDTYAVQHPGQPSPQSIKSVGYHLMRLCRLVERGLPMEQANAEMLNITKARAKLTWLEPPYSQGSVTVADVHTASTADEHKQLVRKWAGSVWDAWSQHHAIIYDWLRDLK